MRAKEFIEDINEDWKTNLKNTALGVAAAGAIGYGTYKADQADKEHAKHNKIINGQAYQQYQNAGPMTRASDSKDVVIDGKPARIWSMYYKGGHTKHFYQFKDSNNSSRF